ncbi:MAG: hypothetical protein JXB35_01585 [Anaerolineae bacterium]|nr:hypothetical protein [Anaerolineae bacterium]
MKEKKLYKHSCGYPITEDAALEHCPGCGERITPWNTKPAEQVFPEQTHAGHMSTFAQWLHTQHPNLARKLQKKLDAALENAQLSESTRAALNEVQTTLQTHTEGARG